MVTNSSRTTNIVPTIQSYLNRMFSMSTSNRSRMSARDRQMAQQLGLEPEPLPDEPYTSPSPYGAGAPGWDPSGFPVGPMPRGQYALDWQYEGNRRAEQRRQALWNDAQNVMRQGLDMLQSYRPGGSAALASGMYGQRASLYGSQAMNTEAPDLLIGWRDRKQQEADAERRQAERFGRAVGLAGLGMQGLMSYSGGGSTTQKFPPGMSGWLQMPSGGGGGTAAAQGAPEGGGGVLGMPPGGSPAAQEMAQMARAGIPFGGVQGGMAASQMAQQGGGGEDLPLGGGGAPQQGFGGGQDAPQQGAGQWGPSAGQTQPGEPGGGRGQPAGRRGGATPWTPPPMSTFAGPEPAANAMMASPVTQMTVYSDWADDRLRRSGVQFQLRGARERLLRALDSAYYDSILGPLPRWIQELHLSGRY